jgi:hypothetical protein
MGRLPKIGLCHFFGFHETAVLSHDKSIPLFVAREKGRV